MKRACVVGALVALVCLSAAPSAQVATWFRADFNGPGGLYNFANRYPQSATTWQTEHLPTGGWAGSGAPHVTVKGCGPQTGRPCNTAENQFNIGWVTPTLTTRTGSTEFVRFRIKFDPFTMFTASRGFGAKFILHGTSGSNRWIIHLYPPYENNGCTLGFESYGSMGWTPPASQWWRASDWGLPPFSRGVGPLAGFTPNVNISWSCAAAVLVHASDYPAQKPQAVGAAPVDGWYHLQFQAITGAAGASGMRVYANNNDQARPSSERLNMPEALSASALNQGVSVGGYWGVAQAQDIGFVIDDFEIGPTFDPNWYPGGVVQPPPCTFAVSPTSGSAPAGGGSVAVAVTASAPTCGWTAQGTVSAPHLSVSPAAGSGSGTVTVGVAAHTALSSRVGTVTVAGQAVTVTQAAFVPLPVTKTTTCAVEVTQTDGAVTGMRVVPPCPAAP